MSRKHSRGLVSVLQNIGKFYGYKVVQIFDRLCEAIVLLAATFTVAWVQRNNELVPLLSAGVSTRRVFLPVLIGAGLLIALGVANQELLIPAALRTNCSPTATTPTVRRCSSSPARTRATASISKACRQSATATSSTRSWSTTLTDGLSHLTAKEARYIPPQEGEPLSGGWLMTGVQPEVVEKLPPASNRSTPAATSCTRPTSTSTCSPATASGSPSPRRRSSATCSAGPTPATSAPSPCNSTCG